MTTQTYTLAQLQWALRERTRRIENNSYSFCSGIADELTLPQLKNAVRRASLPILKERARELKKQMAEWQRCYNMMLHPVSKETCLRWHYKAALDYTEIMDKIVSNLEGLCFDNQR